MAKAKKKPTKKPKAPRKPITLALSKQQKIILGSFLFLLGLALLFSFASYFFTWQADQSEIGLITDREAPTKNWLNKFGSNVSHFFIYDGFGIAAFIFAGLITLSGVYFFFDYAKTQLKRFWFWGVLMMIWLAVFFGFFTEKNALLSGVIGFEINDLLKDYLGLIGAILVMAFLAIIYLVVRLKLTPERVIEAFKQRQKLHPTFLRKRLRLRFLMFLRKKISNPKNQLRNKLPLKNLFSKRSFPKRSLPK